jgi:hypothetical protein
MKSAIRRIDRAIKRLYNLDAPHRAEDFLLKAAPSASTRDALFIHTVGEGAEQELALGISLSEPVQTQLDGFRHWRDRPWTFSQLQAFSVAAEEVSHFHYVIHHAGAGRPVSHLELELQGDIDKFLLSYFAYARAGKENDAFFELLFEQLFYRFSLAQHLNDEERERYLEANRLARRFVLKRFKGLMASKNYEHALQLLRRFYRLNASEKLSLIGPA